jgi:integrase
MKYVDSWVDKKTGIPYARFRRRGHPSVMLPGAIGSPEFMAGYHAVLRGELPAVAAAAARTGRGTINSAVAQYLDSNSFRTRVPSEGARSRQAYTLKKFCSLVGDKPIALLERSYLDRLLADMPTIGVARTCLITIRPFLQWSAMKGLIEADPTAGIRIKLPKSDGHDTWTEEQIAQFEARWPIGTKERLALALTVHTGQRRSDIIKMGRQHLHNGTLVIRQQKTGVQVDVPVHPELSAAIAACPSEHLTFLTMKNGGPYNEKAFNTWFRAACDAAGLPASCVPHGLRKACCRRLAEQGCTPAQIAAISGHLTLKEITRYTAAYDRKRAAQDAMAKLMGARA